MASADAIWSLRMIAKLTHENVVYRYPTGNEKPDFRTICNFKKGRKGLIEAAFKKTVTIAKTLGIPNLGDVSTNGTIMLIYNHCHFCTLAFYNLFVEPLLYTIKNQISNRLTSSMSYSPIRFLVVTICKIRISLLVRSAFNQRGTAFKPERKWN